MGTQGSIQLGEEAVETRIQLDPRAGRPVAASGPDRLHRDPRARVAAAAAA